MPNIGLVADGLRLEGWKSATVRRSLDSMSGEFSLSLSDPWDTGYKQGSVVAGSRVVICDGSDIIMTGYVDNVNVSASAEDHEIEISGRDQVSDLIDCSVTNSPYNYKNQALVSIADTIAQQYAISVTGDEFYRVESFSVQPGESCFEAIDRLCRCGGYIPTATLDGRLHITTAGRERCDTNLVWGQNIESITLSQSAADRYRTYKVIAQKKGSDDSGDASTIAHISAEATDPDIVRDRVLTVMAETSSSIADVKRRAQWEASVRMGRSLNVSVTMATWRDDSGNLWALNQMVDVYAPVVGLYYEPMLISGVDMSFDLHSGSRTVLTLKKREAYLSEPLKPVKLKKPGKLKFSDPFANIRALTGSTLR